MKIPRLFKYFDSQQCEREIEEELHFHLELLTEEHLQPVMTLAEAKAAALKQFGNVEQIKDQCVEISSRKHHSVRALKSFLIVVFSLGVLVRVFSTEIHFMHMGDILIAIGVAGRLFVYVRGLNPTNFRPQHQTSSPLRLNDVQVSIRPYDHRSLTPVERIIADK